MAHPALPILVGRSAVLGLASATATTLLALATVVGTLPEDPIAAFERRLPPWLLVLELGAAISIVAAAWVTSLTRPRVSVGLLIMAFGTLVPVWAGWAWLPVELRMAALAVAPLAVAGSGHVGLRWLEGRPGAGRLWPIHLLALAATATVIVGYDPITDPGCLRTCADAGTLLGPYIGSRTSVLIATILTVTAAVVAVYGLLRAAAGRENHVVIAAAIVATAGFATGWILWVAFWSRMPSPLLLVVPAVGSAAILGAGSVAGSLAVARTRAAASRMAASLRDAVPSARDGGLPVRAIHFAVPAEDRWVDAAGRPVDGGSPTGRPVVISDRGGPFARLVMGSGAEPADVLAGLTPATLLALRNGQLAAVVRARVADVQASRRRIVTASDAERGRIERDLHDSAQQRLVSASFHLSLARGRPGGDRPAVRRAEEAVREALGRLRHLSHGIFPSVLATDGLAAALEDLVLASGVPTTLETESVDVDPETAMAAYAVVAAALGRAGHATPATQVRVTATLRGADLVVRVDLADGIEPDDVELVDATDRVGAIGGSVGFERRETGTSLIAVMRCASS